MFVQNHAHQSDAGRLRYRRRSRMVADGLSVSRYQIKTQSCCGRNGFERLCKMQQRVQIGRHVGTIDRRIEIPKIDDALKGGVPTVLDKLLPVFQRLRSQGKNVATIELEMVSLRGDAAPRAKFAKSRNHPFTHSR